MQFKKTVLAVSLALGLPTVAAAAETPIHAFTGNVGVFSNYIFRGVTQTSENAAVQGGFDYAHASGLYAGVWGSNVSWLSDSGAYRDTSLELDLYGGYKGSFGGDFGYDVGAIYYYYPGKKNPGFISANTTEVYGALSWKWLSAKLSYSTTNYFGYTDSKGSYYLDVSANVPIGASGVTVLAHVGQLMVDGKTTTPGVSNDDLYGYTDWKIGASYALPKDFIVGGYFTDTSAETASYTFAGKNWADKQVAVYIQKTF